LAIRPAASRVSSSTVQLTGETLPFRTQGMRRNRPEVSARESLPPKQHKHSDIKTIKVSDAHTLVRNLKISYDVIKRLEPA